MPFSKYVVIASLVMLSCGKTNPTVQPPLSPPKTDCIVDFISSFNNSEHYLQTSYYYNPDRRLDSSRNNFTICHIKYKDNRIVKREVLYANTRALRNYDSLFYNVNGSLASIKMFAYDETSLEFVNDINFKFSYTGSQLTGLEYEFEKNNKQVVSRYTYAYDPQRNIISNTANNYDGSISQAKYYYRDTVNKLSQLSVPIGLYMSTTGLARPELIPFDLPLFLSAKAMNKYDDWSGNTGIAVEVKAIESMITVKVNGLLLHTFGLACQ